MQYNETTNTPCTDIETGQNKEADISHKSGVILEQSDQNIIYIKTETKDDECEEDSVNEECNDSHSILGTSSVDPAIIQNSSICLPSVVPQIYLPMNFMPIILPMNTAPIFIPPANFPTVIVPIKTGPSQNEMRTVPYQNEIKTEACQNEIRTEPCKNEIAETHQNKIITGPCQNDKITELNNELSQIQVKTEPNEEDPIDKSLNCFSGESSTYCDVDVKMEDSEGSLLIKEKRVIYNLSWLFKNIKSELDAANFLQNQDIIPLIKLCKNRHHMELKENDDIVKWACPKVSCGEVKSLRAKTWLHVVPIPLKKLILLIYSWSQEYTTMKFCRKEVGITDEVVVDFHNSIREVCARSILIRRILIGGPHKTVEIGESSYSEDNTERWVFGGVCRETKELFLNAVPDRRRKTILDCIKANVSPGTTIVSDRCKEYPKFDKIDGYNYTHHTVNLSENFVDPKTGAHTQTIKTIWNGLKQINKRCCGSSSHVVESYLSEFLWRKRNSSTDLFQKIMYDISKAGKEF